MDDILSLGGAVRGWDGWVSHEDFKLLKKKNLLLLENNSSSILLVIIKKRRVLGLLLSAIMYIVLISQPCSQPSPK